MSEGNPGGPSNPPKAVPSLVKKQSDVTRLGTQKLKFVPTLPARRKKEEAKEEPAPAPSTTSDRGRGRGRGRGDDRGRGRGRGDGPGRGGAPPRPPQVEMTASGPFAMGPAMQGASGARRAAPQSNYMPIMPGGPSRGPIGAGLTNTTAPGVGVKREVNDLGLPKKEEAPIDDDGEVYSDPDEGVEIVDMENVRGMDWMAPESLKKEKAKGKGKARRKEADVKGKGKGKEDAKPDVEMADATPSRVQSEDVESAEDSGEAKVNLANALNLSDSEEEEEMEDIIHDFASRLDIDTDGSHNHDPLYFFQFPHPFPTFVSPSASSAEGKGKAKETNPEKSDATPKKVSFAPDVKPAVPPAPSSQPTATQPGNTADTKQESEPAIEGVIGQLEVYASGKVKMRLGNGILLDVTGSTQPSFLQHIVYVDQENKRLCVLGEVYRRFSVAPDVDSLLDTLENAAVQPGVGDVGDLDGLIVMDTT